MAEVSRPLTEGLDARHFAHPLDVSARRRIDRVIAGRPRIQRFFEAAERSTEQKQYTMHLADNTRLSRRQAGSIYRIVEQVATDAGMPCPRVFLDTKPDLNASALGQHQPIIVIHSALVDQCSEVQIRAVIAHELGHIRCKHTFYRTVANGFAPVAALASSLPGGALIALMLQWHLFDWVRKSELSADRFALLVTGDLDAVQQVLVHLAGGASSVRDELSTAEFRAQAKEYRDATAMRQRNQTMTDKIEYYVTELMLNPDVSKHPLPAVRFVELEDWARSRQYELLCQGNLTEAEMHPFQYMPETVPDDDFDPSALEGAMTAAPVLRQAAAEVAGKWKDWSAKLSAPAQTGAQHPAGWYPDPNGANLMRWWNGTSWTAETHSP
ncbi:M48 family metalloprotease [Mycobacterium sp. SMC-13]|uniref:M48 family metalloprotease n=1 Tax=Mycobacterium sp. SMC-13 TaxID=3381626 RepID=UPI003876463E